MLHQLEEAFLIDKLHQHQYILYLEFFDLAIQHCFQQCDYEIVCFSAVGPLRKLVPILLLQCLSPHQRLPLQPLWGKPCLRPQKRLLRRKLLLLFTLLLSFWAVPSTLRTWWSVCPPVVSTGLLSVFICPLISLLFIPTFTS